MSPRKRSGIDAVALARYVLAAGLALAAANGCQQRTAPAPVRIDSKTEAKLHELLESTEPSDTGSGLQRVQSFLGTGTVVESKEFEQRTGFTLKNPSKVECRIWNDSDGGNWIAIAFDRETYNPVAYQSNVQP